MSEERDDRLQRLKIYGELLFSCNGTGELFDSENKPWECQFEAGQLQNGDCLLLCDIIGAIPTFPLLRDPPARSQGGQRTAEL